jgi:hypothetical protein
MYRVAGSGIAVESPAPEGVQSRKQENRSRLAKKHVGPQLSVWPKEGFWKNFGTESAG